MRCKPKLPKTMKGKVFPRINSRMLPSIMSIPPKKKYVAVPAAPPPPAPLQPIKAHDSGVKQSRKPITEMGVGFPNVFLRSPFTLFCGQRYSFSYSSGDTGILAAVPAVRILSSSGPSGDVTTWLVWPFDIVFGKIQSWLFSAVVEDCFVSRVLKGMRAGTRTST